MVCLGFSVTTWILQLLADGCCQSGVGLPEVGGSGGIFRVDSTEANADLIVVVDVIVIVDVDM